jgi:hypothetical protein
VREKNEILGAGELRELSYLVLETNERREMKKYKTERKKSNKTKITGTRNGNKREREREKMGRGRENWKKRTAVEN